MQFLGLLHKDIFTLARKYFIGSIYNKLSLEILPQDGWLRNKGPGCIKGSTLSGLNNDHFLISSVIEYFLQFNLIYR